MIFDENIKICDKCRGTGYISEIPDGVCPSCNGAGVFLMKDSKRYFVSNSGYINFSERKRLKIYKLILTILLIIVFLILLISIMFVIN